MRSIRFDPESQIRFWAKVQTDKVANCWNWLASTTKAGKGYGHHDGVLAHRYAWELFYGPIDGDLKVLHTCDNPKCVNPSHLKLGTQQENMQDRRDKNRTAYGLKLPGTKLTDDKVIVIWSKIVAGVPLRAIGEEYGVHENTISQIKRRLIWKRVTDRLQQDTL